MNRHTLSLASVALALVYGGQAAGAQVADRSPLRPRGFSTMRMVTLGPGRSETTFTLTEPSGVILLARLTVRHGVRAFVDARIPNLAGARMSSVDPVSSCRRRGPLDVCTQQEEWCPMPQAVWHFRLVKLAGPAGQLRVDFVIGAPPPGQ